MFYCWKKKKGTLELSNWKKSHCLLSHTNVNCPYAYRCDPAHFSCCVKSRLQMEMRDMTVSNGLIPSPRAEALTGWCPGSGHFPALGSPSPAGKAMRGLVLVQPRCCLRHCMASSASSSRSPGLLMGSWKGWRKGRDFWRPSGPILRA